jgi:hypothetical protein
MKLRRPAKDTDSDRRSRRPAGTRMSVSSTFAYRSQRSDDAVNLGRQAERQRTTPRKTMELMAQRTGLVALAVIILILIVNILSLSPNPKIKLLDPSSQIQLTPTTTAEYQSAAKKALSGSILNSNKLTVDTEAVSNKLMDEYPDLVSVNVTVPLVSRQPTVYVEPSQPALVLVEPKASYEINTNGRAIATSVSQQGFGKSLPVVVDQSGLNVAVHSQPLSANYVNFVLEVVGQLNAKGYTVSQMTLPNGTDELDASIAGQPYFVKFNLESNDPRQQAGTFLATINYLKSKNITPSKYVDVRLDGRAYYV